MTATAANGGVVGITPGDANADLAGHQVDLRTSHPGGNPAETVICIVVPYESNGWTYFQYYFVKVSREAPIATDATLEALEVEDYDLSPSFVYDLLDYTVSAGHDSETATIRAVANQSDATVAYNPAETDANTAGYQRTLSAGDNLVTITVTAPDGATTQDYTVTVNQPAPPSTDATLKSLAAAGATLSPAFQSGVKSYATTVRSRIALLNLALAATDDGAAIEVNPPDANPEAEGLQIPVNVGVNTVTITVTAEDGSATETYTLTVNRNSLAMEEAPLSSLSVAGATLFPEFNADVLAYTALVGNDQARVTITATGQNAGSTVELDLTDQDAATAGYQVDLAEGRNTIKITVTNVDMPGTDSEREVAREYRLTIFRSPAAANTEGFLQVDAGWHNGCGLRVDHTISCKTSSYSIVGNVPDGIFERVSVKRWVGCALRGDGSQHCWDSDGNLTNRTGLKVGDFSMSAEYAGDHCYLKTNGDLACSSSGGRTHTVEGPFKAIGEARRAVCAIRSDDLVRCWGYWGSRMITLDLPNEYRSTEFKFISGGYSHACGIGKEDNATLCWRWHHTPNGYPLNERISALPTPSVEYTFVDSGSHEQSCGVRVDGTVDCWDEDGSIFRKRSRAPGEADIGYHSVTLDWEAAICGLRKDNRMKCWDWEGRVLGTPHNNSPWRNNAQLLGIDLGEASLSPGFDRDVLAYTASVGNDVAYVTVKPELTNSLAYSTIYSDTAGAAGDDGVVPLAVGENVIRVHVISADRTASSIYTVTITRAAGSMSL